MSEQVLLCGEGSTDYGRRDYNSFQWLEGPVQPIIRKSMGIAISFEYVEKSELKQLRIQRGPKSGHSMKSFKLSVLAKQRNIKTVICYIDADKITSKGKKETVARESFLSVYDQIKEGFETFNKSFSAGNRHPIAGIAMVPLKMIECWLLSDEHSFSQCFGKTPTLPPLPARPELIWGEKNDPQSNYPKNWMKRVLMQYPGIESNRETFKMIADEIDIETLRKKCPISFEAFFKDVDKINVLNTSV